jgi:hypothetical protein
MMMISSSSCAGDDYIGSIHGADPALHFDVDRHADQLMAAGGGGGSSPAINALLQYNRHPAADQYPFDDPPARRRLAPRSDDRRLTLDDDTCADHQRDDRELEAEAAAAPSSSAGRFMILPALPRLESPARASITAASSSSSSSSSSCSCRSNYMGGGNLACRMIGARNHGVICMAPTDHSSRITDQHVVDDDGDGDDYDDDDDDDDDDRQGNDAASLDHPFPAYMNIAAAAAAAARDDQDHADPSLISSNMHHIDAGMSLYDDHCIADVIAPDPNHVHDQQLLPAGDAAAAGDFDQYDDYNYLINPLADHQQWANYAHEYAASGLDQSCNDELIYNKRSD